MGQGGILFGHGDHTNEETDKGAPRLKIGDFDQTVPVGAADKTVVFIVSLKTAAKLQMETWFYDAQGRELCGAYYAYARRLWKQQ